MLNEKTLTQGWFILWEVMENARTIRSSQAHKNQPLTHHLATRGIHVALRSFFALSQTKAIKFRNSLGNTQCKKLQQASKF